MAVNTSVFEIDAGRTIGSDDDLELVKSLGVVRIPVDWICKGKELTLSYHLFVQVPTCTPFLKSYVPHKKLLHSSARSAGAANTG